MSFTKRYQNLNAAQKQAVDTIDGPVMVVAGPGTGKTELLSVRAANILQKTDTLPENILCLTFTESGQAAMRERLVDIIGKDAYKVAIHTFHSFGSEIIGQNRDYFYRNALFEPADDLKQYEILRSIFEELDFSNPLSSMMNDEYTHLSDAKRTISELKRNSALTSDELRAVIDQSEASLDLIERTLSPILSERTSPAMGDKLRDVQEILRDHVATLESLHGVIPLARVMYESFETMLEDTLSIHATKPITAWKALWFERNSAKELVCKNRKRLAKLKALSFVYYEYLHRMEKAGLYDYDDMIMQVVHAVEVYDDLRFNLQEKYLYIMVDEFQDTNLAQLRIIHSLTDNPVNEGRPNILVVGDDDQAIYGFQGADVSNILSFSDSYPTRELIVLTDNYRSVAPILTHSRTVIAQGTDRLESRIPELDKQLTANKKDSGVVSLLKAPSIDGERAAIVQRIKMAIEEGANPSSIAVLARRHADIQSLLPFFRHENIPVRYEYEESVLDSAPITALEGIARVILALSKGEHDLVQALLPEALAHPAWGIEATELWQLSLNAYTSRQHWMEVMATTPRFVHIHLWLVERAKEATELELEPLLDRLMGTFLAEAEEGEAAQQESPYYRYFFSAEARAKDPEAYLRYLEALRTIRGRLRDHAPGQALTLNSFIDFIELHRRLNITISANSYSVASDTPAVQLLTAHKSKGLEFDTVYIFNSVDSLWGQSVRTMSRSISYPENLPLAPAGNTADERLRLFYVAMTRAKQTLIITYAETNDSDKTTLAADFLLPTNLTADETPEQSLGTTTEIAEQAWYQPYTTMTKELSDLLSPHVEKFKLSATALNNFLDVTRGGPQYFLLNNLLHFPKTKNAHAAYGTAIHTALQLVHTHMTATGERKPLEDTLHDFEVALKKERLSERDFQQFLQRGSDDLTTFLNSNVIPIRATQKAEVSFGYQDVRVGACRLTGSLDMIDIDKEAKTISVVDYKTGHPSYDWNKGDDRQKAKLHRYHQQLMFYKVLVEKSPEYHTYTVTEGCLAFIEPTKAKESIILPLDIEHEDTTRTEQLIEAVWRHISTCSFPDTSAYSADLKGILAFEQDLIDGTV